MTSPKVVVIGAGVAGITAAACLISSGIDDVTVLEAQDYVGGRVKAEVVDGQSVELGAQYVHGRDGNPAYEIVQRRGLAHSAQPDNASEVFNIPDVFLTPHNQTIALTQEIQSYVDYLCERLDKNYDENVQINDRGDSEGDLYEAAYMEYLDTLDANKKPLFTAIYRWFKLYQIVDTASANLSDLSVSALYRYRVLPGPRDTYVTGGMTSVLNVISGLVPSDRIHLNTPVKNINWSKATTGGQLKVTCDNGSEILADYIIVTVSMGYLQANCRTLFTPDLPPRDKLAIDHVGFGGVGKIFLKWDEPFVGYTQLDGVQMFEILWLDDQPVHLQNDRSQLKKLNGQPWWFGIHSFETVYGCPNVLEVWLGKEEAALSEKLGDEEVKLICYEIVQKCFHTITVPPPTAVYRTRWISNQYILGTYSFLSTSICQDDLNHLGQPLPSKENPRVLFAGEGFAREFISTFHGAYLSGQEQANVILQKENKGAVRLIDFV